MNASLGFRINGDVTNDRMLVDWRRAFYAYANMNELIDFDREGYLSAFTFDETFRAHMNAKGSPKAFDGPCSVQYLGFDFDAIDSTKEALDDARLDCTRLGHFLLDRYGLFESQLLVFFSGGKGFHVGLPAALWQPDTSGTFAHTAKAMALRLAKLAEVNIDASICDKQRCFRSPNSRHAKTGLHKRYLPLSVITHLNIDGIRDLAKQPEVFYLPTITATSAKAMADWADACQDAERTVKPMARIATEAKLNRSTMAFIREGATTGDRHRLLFSAAANLAELGCSQSLAEELLGESACDSGLSPSDIRRQIACGIEHAKGVQLG